MLWCNKPQPSNTWFPSEHCFFFFLVYYNWFSLKIVTLPKPWVLSLLPVLSCLLYQMVDKSKTREPCTAAGSSLFLDDLQGCPSLMAPTWPWKGQWRWSSLLSHPGWGFACSCHIFLGKKKNWNLVSRFLAEHSDLPGSCARLDSTKLPVVLARVI